MHRAELQMDMDSQWDTSQTSESPLWISSWCGEASSELSDGKVPVTRRPTTTARGDFFLHHWWCVPCNFGGCDCHASFGANNASTDAAQLDILEQQENVGRWPGWATLKWIQHLFCQLMIWKFNSTCNMSGHLPLVNLNRCLVHSSSIEIYIMLWMLDQHILHSSSSISAILVVGRLSWILSWIPSTCRWRSGELMEVSGDKVWAPSDPANVGSRLVLLGMTLYCTQLLYNCNIL